MSKDPMPQHLVYECTACGRKIASNWTVSRYERPAGLMRGYPSRGLCKRDIDRIDKYGTPERHTSRVAEVAEEYQHLRDMGDGHDSAVRNLSRSLGIQPESVKQSLRRARRRGLELAA